MTDREQWFKDRIGKRVFRTKTICDCEVCKESDETGFMILNEDDAEFCFLCEQDSQIRHFDTKEEVKQFEESLK